MFHWLLFYPAQQLKTLSIMDCLLIYPHSIFIYLFIRPIRLSLMPIVLIELQCSELWLRGREREKFVLLLRWAKTLNVSVRVTLVSSAKNVKSISVVCGDGIIKRRRGRSLLIAFCREHGIKTDTFRWSFLQHCSERKGHDVVFLSKAQRIFNIKEEITLPLQ